MAEAPGKLLSAIKRTRATPVGGIVSIDAFHTLTQSQQVSFVNPYYVVFQICTRYAAVPSINSSCMRLANCLQPECFGRLHVGRFKSRRRLYSGVEV